jgi:hypothetical protein
VSTSEYVEAGELISTTTDLYTDENGRTWHIMRRAGGGVCLYNTLPDVGVHFVMWDSYDNQPPSARTREILWELEQMQEAINTLLNKAAAVAG